MLFFLSAVVNNADQKFACDIVYLDFRKAFDSVPHKELLFKLWLMGITGDLWFWFKSYLISGRTHLTSFHPNLLQDLTLLEKTQRKAT